MTEDEMIGWHHRLDKHELEQALGVVDGQGSLACCSPWGRKELDTIEGLNRRRQWHPTPVLCLENPMDGESGIFIYFLII